MSKKPGARNVRHVMGLLWGWLLSLIITEFFKGSYNSLDLVMRNKHERPDIVAAMILTLLACALFLAKQVADLALYYGSIEEFDFRYQESRGVSTLFRYIAENTLDVAVLYFTYGAIQEICTQNLKENITNYIPKRAIGSGLLLSMAITESLWLLWDCLYLYKHKISSKKRHEQRQLVIRWTKTNVAWALLFFGLYYMWDHHVHAEALDVPSTLCFLFLPALIYFLSYQFWFADYYTQPEADGEKEFGSGGGQSATSVPQSRP